MLLVFVSLRAHGNEVVGELGEGRTLSVRVDPQSAPLRSEAPGRWGFELTLSGALTETGRLWIRPAAVGRRLPTLRTREVVLRSGKQKLAFALPEVGAADGAVTSLVLSWESSRGDVVELGVIHEPAFLSHHRQFALGFVRTATQEDRYRPAVMQWSWRSGAYSPVAFDTTVVPFSPNEVPTRPLALLAYDVVVVAGDAVRDLTAEQYAALATWVEAGGALALVFGDDLGPHGLGFVQQLVRSAGKPWVVTRRFDGRLSLGPEQGATQSFGVGMGRVALFNSIKPPQEHGSWLTMGGYLWGMTNVQLGEVSRNPFERLSVRRDPRPRSEVSRFIDDLKSSEFQMIPPSILALAGIVYLVLIGPFDRWFLGRLGKRRWTWLWMPTVTVLFAVFLVGVTEHYFGAVSSERRWVIVDVGEGGKVLRAHCIELSLLSRTREVEKTLVDETYTAIDAKRFSTTYRLPPDPISQIEYSGSYPYDYRVRQTVPKWSAVLHMRAWLPSENVPSWLEPVLERDLNYDSVTDALITATRSGNRVHEDAVQEELRAHLGWDWGRFDANYYAFRRSLFRIGEPSSGWVPIESLVPRWADNVRVPAPSGAGHFDALTVFLDVGDSRIEIHDVMDGARVVIRRTFREGGS